MTFRQKERLSNNEKKDKRRGMTYSIIFHLILFLLIFFPLISNTDRSEDLTFIEVVFEDSSPSAPESQMAESSEAAPMPFAEELSEEEAQAEEQPTPVEPIDVTTPDIQQQSEVETDLRTRDFSDIMAGRRTPDPEPEVEEVEEIPEPVEEPAPAEVERPTPVENTRTRTETARDFGSPTGRDRPTNSADDGSGSAEAQGSGDRSSSSAGDARTPNPRGGGSGGVDRTQWSGFQGTGPLKRSIKTYGPTPSLSGESGTIMIRLCVDRNGTMIFKEINKSGTTITNPELLKKALEVMDEFVFDQDPSAPFRECGNYTIRFKNPGD
nr:hypothetical protein [Saprospiraceae bacterium]